MILWIVALFLVGATLLFAEFFVPGLIMGIIGVTCLVTSAVLAVIHYPENALFILLGEGIGVAMVLAAGMYMLPRSMVGRAMTLERTQDTGDGYVASETDESLLGSLAEVVTALRPAGTIRVHDRRLSAVSRGDFIDAGHLVRIVEVHGNRLVVEAAQAEGKDALP